MGSRPGTAGARPLRPSEKEMMRGKEATRRQRGREEEQKKSKKKKIRSPC
jgi:hypothetical protein